MRMAKVVAAQMDMTLKDLIRRALERELRSLSRESFRDPQPVHVVDEDGLPCLPRRGAVLTDSLVNQLREQQGI